MVFGENFRKQVAERKALEVKTEIKPISENPFYKSLPKRPVIKTWQDYISELAQKRMDGLVKQKDIAELTGFDTGYISRFFSAKRSPSLKTYVTIANAIERLAK
jgi:transcriptional regulator with XRE-family HTH domain